MRITTVMAYGLLTLVLAACGQNQETGASVASAGSPAATTSAASTASGNDGGLKFAQCMRENGIEMPDPEGSDGRIQVRLPEGADPQKAKTAMEQCKQHLPNGGEPEQADPQKLEQQRKFAQCMRDNGVPKFPDPDASGGFKMGPDTGMDPNDPKVQAARQTCAKFQPAAPSGAPTETWSGG
ncbi:hypothetical protein GCM10022419_124530 [Nonomuraea rosea]|uniref:Secreted protein n=1 Tax=Nonomuraea rosea TaxID=638574 RepID=A0ABP6ZVU7_9ACTN